MLERLLAKLDEVLCPNNRILGLMKRIQQALSPRGVTSTTSDDLGEVIRSVNTDDILERWDEVILQLKRTHLHLFLISGFDGIEEDSSLVIKPKRHRLLGVSAVEDEDLADFMHVQDQKADGNAGGSSTGGTRHTRVLNTIVTDEISGASLSSNQITLPAGTFEIVARAPCRAGNNNRLFWVETGGPTDDILGINSVARGPAGNDAESLAYLYGRITISSSTTYELQHWIASTKATTGLGATDTDTGANVEIYADVQIKKLA